VIIGYGALLWWRNRLSQQRSENQRRLAPIAGLALTVAFALFMATQLRSVHIRAEFFLYVSALVVLANISAQVSRVRALSVTIGLWGGIIACVGAAAVTSFILPLLAYYGLGHFEDRYMASVAALQMVAGLIWGALAGLSLRCISCDSETPLTTLLAFSVAPLLIVFMLGIGIVADQLRWIPDLQTFASEWDERHQYILEQRDNGLRQIKMWPLSYNLASEFWDPSAPRVRHNELRCAAIYYSVDLIEMTDD